MKLMVLGLVEPNDMVNVTHKLCKEIIVMQIKKMINSCFDNFCRKL
jgi:hypothetical protein